MLLMVWVTRCFLPEPCTSGPDESRVPMFFLGRLAELGPCASVRCIRERWGRLQVPGRLDESGVAAEPAAAAAALADTAEVACAAAPEELVGHWWWQHLVFVLRGASSLYHRVVFLELV